MQVKGNQSDLLDVCKLLPGYQSPHQVNVENDKGHGRIEMRTVSTFQPSPKWFPSGWNTHLQQAIKVDRVVTSTKRGVTNERFETSWWVSTVVLTAKEAQSAIRGHWAIENQNHYIRDVILHEDASRMRIKPGVMASLRSLALNCINASGSKCVARTIYSNILNFNKLSDVAKMRT